MGKQRRQRAKLHTAAQNPHSQLKTNEFMDTTPNLSFSSDAFPLSSPENPFVGLNIDFNALRKNLSDDTKSVKSYKSLKSELGQDKALSKKDKLKLRKELLLRKIDTVNQLTKEKRKKKKPTTVLGSVNPLKDALPSLQSLLKSKSDPIDVPHITKPKGIQKNSKRKKEMFENVASLKKLLKNKSKDENPLLAISEHVKAFVQKERMSSVK